MTKVACVIPVRDEATRIGAVVQVVLASPLIDQLVVVDNASGDNTAEVAREAGACVIDCPVVGKYEAMATGVANTEADVILFLDADLYNFTTEHIEQLLLPVLNCEAEMVCGTLDRPKALKLVLRFWGGLTGQRAVNRKVWEAMPGGSGFEAEALLNSICRKKSWTILRRELAGVTHTGKREKFPLPKAFKEYVLGYGVAAKAYVRTARPDWGK